MRRIASGLQRFGISASSTYALTRSPVSYRDLSKEQPSLGERILPPYFHGLYDTLTDANQSECNPFDSEAWVQTVRHVMDNIAERQCNFSYSPDSHLIPFATLLANAAISIGKLRVLDFGGGMGDNYLQISPVLFGYVKERLDYHIVDTPRNCAAGAEFWAKKQFVPQFNVGVAPPGDFDIVMICGTLQYIPDWGGLLRELGSRTRQFLYVTRTPTNNGVPSFYSRQLVVPAVGTWAGRYIGSIGMAVLNPSHMQKVAAEAGMRPIFSTPLFGYDAGMSSFSAPQNAVAQSTILFANYKQLQE